MRVLLGSWLRVVCPVPQEAGCCLGLGAAEGGFLGVRVMSEPVSGTLGAAFASELRRLQRLDLSDPEVPSQPLPKGEAPGDTLLS